MTGTQPRRTPVSIVCVFNDLDVRTTCLDASINAGLPDAPETEYLPVDNREGRFSSAGAALNDGARRARHDVVVFVHQDVYLHSLVALEDAAAALQDDPGDGTARRRRHHVVRLGRRRGARPRRDDRGALVTVGPGRQRRRGPLPDRARARARASRSASTPTWRGTPTRSSTARASAARACACGPTTSSLTHNSMTTNLDRLAEAHAHVAQAYPDLLPLHTTCGVVRAAPHRGRWSTAWRRRHGVATWLRESLAAARLARLDGRGTRDVVLGDIRLTVDDVLDVVGRRAPRRREPAPQPRGRTAVEPGVGDPPRPGRLRGRRRPSTTSPGRSRARARPGAARRRTSTRPRCAPSRPRLRDVPHLVGLAQDTGGWVLVGAAVGRRPRTLADAPQRPLRAAAPSCHRPGELRRCTRGARPVAGSCDVGRTSRRRAGSAPPRVAARVAAGALGVAVGLVDLTSPGLRYGYVHPLARALLRRPLASLPAVAGAAFHPLADRRRRARARPALRARRRLPRRRRDRARHRDAGRGAGSGRDRARRRLPGRRGSGPPGSGSSASR